MPSIPHPTIPCTTGSSTADDPAPIPSPHSPLFPRRSPRAMDAAGGAAEVAETNSFECVVCLDILYKPIVLACGHTYCFWCVHKAMSGFVESNCAVCRQPYNHFPSICQLLHLLIRKIDPVAYNRREKEIFEEERSADMFSPQLPDCMLEGCGAKQISHDADASCPQDRCEAVCVSDLLCANCNEILFQPAVLNCGHVYCGSCMVNMFSGTIDCQVCQSRHPGDPPKVCLDLDHFLEKHFPEEYEKRRALFQIERGPQIGSQSSSSASTSTVKKKVVLEIKNGVLCLDKDVPEIHVGIGCDSCGMCPITGRRYRCRDCKEAVGFDLCEHCYTSSSKLPGRFNQQHTPDHTFEIDDSKLFINLLRNSINELSQ